MDAPALMLASLTDPVCALSSMICSLSTNSVIATMNFTRPSCPATQQDCGIPLLSTHRALTRGSDARYAYELEANC
ncbi:hypothetical protein BD309DRAFT_966153 [Dichomitus squalens]|uniref:Uncharacterized protein n=1 Tax=Dichomitus squalens TaxID=114155 RepID=A0A4Q9PYW2_9APHY|nr:hypothetical protein BD309DRAFT_966153 [Dichomitus squalens]TBU59514.1 hypothetical protein BD310DRAFT_408903 [Dichomitus squalens]